MTIYEELQQSKLRVNTLKLHTKDLENIIKDKDSKINILESQAGKRKLLIKELRSTIYQQKKHISNILDGRKKDRLRGRK